MRNTSTLGPVTVQHGCDCGDVIRQKAARLGVDVTVSTLPPLVETGYETFATTCRHGETWYAEPTSEQIAQWARDGVE